MSRRLLLILFSLIFAIAALGFVWQWIFLHRQPATTALVDDGSPRFAAHECWFSVPWNRRIECGTFFTDDRNGRFQLPVVIVRDESNPHHAEPLVYLSGGPGGASGLSSDDIEGWFFWIDEMQLQRDLVLVDLRGTGLSKPQWQCRHYNRFVIESWQRSMSLAEESAGAFKATRNCLDDAMRDGFVAENYLTTHNARDMSHLLPLLGYQRWHILGASYGTRVAMEWVRHFPDGVASLVLDSSYPFQRGVLLEWPQLLAHSFEQFWRYCSDAIACANGRTAQQLEQSFWQSVEKLQQQPLQLTVQSWWDSSSYSVVLNDYRLVAVLYGALYDNSLYDSIVPAFNEILQQATFETLTALVEHSINFEIAPNFNTLVYFATECAETPNISQEQYQQFRENYPRWLNYTEFDLASDACQLFTKRSDLVEFRQAFAADIPTLILVGELDPVTPPSWSQELHSNLPNSHLQVVPQIGHGAITSSLCGALIVEFLSSGTQGLTQSCVPFGSN